MARSCVVVMMKYSRAMDHDRGQRHNIYNIFMLSHMCFFSEEAHALPESVMWLYGLCHISESMAADPHRLKPLLSLHGGGNGGAGGFGAALLACVP